MDVGVVVAGLGGVSWPGVLTGAGGNGNAEHRGLEVVELVGPVDPQMVLARVRLVAGVAGRLLVLIVGEVRQDPRKGGLHIGLGAPGQGSAAVRYSGLPWEWLVGELAIRPAGSTTVLLDVAAETGAWDAVRAGGLPDVPGVGVFGRVVRQARESKWRRLRGGTAPAAPTYLQECVRLWRAGGRMPFAELHERAAATAHATEESQALFVASTTAEHPALSNVPQGGPGAWQPAPAPYESQAPDARTALPPWAPDAGHLLPDGSAPPPPANGAAPQPYGAPPSRPYPAEPAVSSVPSVAGHPDPDGFRPPASQDPAGHPPSYDAAAPSDPYDVPPPTAADHSAPARRNASAPRPDGPVSAQARGGSGGRTSGEENPHEAIMNAARDGRYEEAEAVAAAWQESAEQIEGPGSEGVLHWVEVRADLARLSGAPARSCELWMAVARGRLELGEAEGASEVEGAVDRAHHQWERLRGQDEESARELAPELVVLRRRVPGRQPGAVRLLEEHTERLLGGVDH